MNPAVDVLARLAVAGGDGGPGAQVAVAASGAHRPVTGSPVTESPVTDSPVVEGPPPVGWSHTWSAGVDGAGSPIHDRTVFPLYSAGKPVLAAAVLAAVSDGLLALDAPLRAAGAPVPPACAGLTVASILRHEAGLRSPPGLAVRFLPDRLRGEVLAGLRPDGPYPTYSEVAGWWLLGTLLEHVRAAPVDEAVADLARRGLAVDGLVVSPRGHPYDRIVDRIGVSAVPVGGRTIPNWAERGRTYAGRWDPAAGLYGSMGDLARFHASLLARAAGDDRFGELLRGAIRTRRRSPMDPGLGRAGSFGHGVMTDLATTWCAPGLGVDAFGHTGFRSMVVAGADPAAGLGFAICVPHADEAGAPARRALPALALAAT